jgi:hypothetical protein
VVTAELTTSGGKDGKTEEEVGEEGGVGDEDEAGEGDEETKIGEAEEAPRTKPGTPPGDKSRMAQSASIRVSGGSLGALQAANGRVVAGGEGIVEPPPCGVWSLEFDLLASVGGLALTVTLGSSSMTVEQGGDGEREAVFCGSCEWERAALNPERCFGSSVEE